MLRSRLFESVNGTAVIRLSRVITIGILLVLWDGLPLAALGLPGHYGKQVVAAISLLGFVGFVVTRARSQWRMNRWEWYSLLLFLFCAFVSFVSNTFIFHNTAADWIPALYVMTPILIPFALRTLRISAGEVLYGIFSVGLLGALLVCADQLVQFSVLDKYQRIATTDAELRRVVIFKNESAIALVLAWVAFVRLGIRRGVIALLALLPIGVSLFVVSESRLAIVGSVMAIAAFSLAVARGRVRFRTVKWAALFLLTIAPFVLSKYVNQYLGSQDYFKEDSSYAWRLLTAAHYQGLFDQTSGFGFGVMSTAPDRQTVLAQSVHRSGPASDYGFLLADIGLLGGMYQFGYVGLAIILLMTWKMGSFMVRSGRINQEYAVGAIGCMVLTFLISPVPMNWFTLEWTVLLGGLLWYVCSATERSARLATKLTERTAP